MIKNKFSMHNLHRLRFVGLAICGLILLLWLASSALHYYRLNRQLAGETEENKKLEESNQQLEKDISALAKDPKYLEQTAREQFGLLKKNELIYQFGEPKNEK